MSVPAEQLPDEIALARVTQARRPQAIANAISFVRLFSAAPIFAWIVTHPEYRSWGLAAVVGGNAVGDKVDGHFGGQANELRGGILDELGKRLDKWADKALVHGVMGGVAMREFLNGNNRYAKRVAAHQTGFAVRDLITTTLCSDIEAQSIGKYKTGAQNSTITAMVMPGLGTETGEQLIQTALWVDNSLSLVSAAQLMRKKILRLKTTGAAESWPELLSANGPADILTVIPFEHPPAEPPT